MRKLLKYLKPYRKECVISPLFKLLEAIFDLLVPLVVRDIIDNGVTRGGGYVTGRFGILIAFAIIGLACALVAQYYAAKAAVGFSTGLRRDLFSHIQGFSYAQTDRIGTSTLITRMTADVNQLQSGVNMTLRLFLRSPIIVFGAVIMGFAVNPRSALVFVLIIPLLAVVVFGIMIKSIPLYRKVQKNLDGVTSSTRETLAGVRVIRAFRKENEEIRHFDEINEAHYRVQNTVGKLNALMNPLTLLLVNLGTILLLWSGAIRVNIGDMTQGEVVAMTNYMAQILVELVKLASLIITITKATACGNRIGEVLNKVPEATEQPKNDPLPTNRSAITFRDVSMTYKNAGAESLEGITFDIEHGQTLGIIGSTGSGKSTLVNLIPRFYHAGKGQILIDGKDIESYSEESLRDKIGVVAQKSVLFKGTIRSNLQWGDAHADDTVFDEALKTAQAYDFVMQKDGGLDAPVEQSGKNFSGGQRQRLCIARALAKRPEILILDDSASALDYATDAKLRMALRELPYHPTTVVVSQRTASIMHADKIVVLDDGKMVGVGTHDELMKNCPVYIEIYQSQFSGNEGNNK